MHITKLQVEVESIKVKYAKDLKEVSDKNAQLIKDIQTRHTDQIKQLSELSSKRD